MRCGKEASMAKLFASRTALKLRLKPSKCSAAMAIQRIIRLSAYFRDAKVCEIYEGTSEIQRIVISKQSINQIKEGGYSMNFQLTEEHEMIRKMVRDFAKNEVAPTAAERDEEERFDREIFDKMAELGLTGIPWPEEYGGIGSDYLSYVIAVEEFSRVCASTRCNVICPYFSCWLADL